MRLSKFYKNYFKAMITRITVTLSEVEMHLFNSKMSNICYFSWASTTLSLTDEQDEIH